MEESPADGANVETPMENIQVQSEVEKSMLVGNPSAVDDAPGQSNPSAADDAPGQSNPPAADDVPGQDNRPAADDVPGRDNRPAADDAPVQSNPPAADDAPVQDNPPAADNAPGQGNDTPLAADMPAEAQVSLNPPEAVPKEEQSETENLASVEVVEDIPAVTEDSIERLMGQLKMDQDEFKQYLKPYEPVLISEDPSVIEGEDLLYDLVMKNASSVFVETDDLICEQAINILKSLSLPLYVVRLDTIDNGEKVKEILFESSDRRELPMIFIKGQLIGGYGELWFLYFTHLITYLFDERHTSFSSNFSFGYEVVIIGGGVAGISAALEAAKLGKKVAIINYVAPTSHGRSWDIGGTSVNVGSITKNLLYSASNYGNILDGYGLEDEISDTPSWHELMTNIRDYIKSVNFSLRCQLKEAGIESYNARARFQTSHIIEMRFPTTNEKKTLTSSVTIVASGSRPRCPRYIQGGEEHCYSTDDFYRTGQCPGKTLVLTSTAMGLECATVLANFNYPVTVLAEPPITKQIDWEIFRRIKNHMKLKKVKFLEKIQIESIEPVTDPEIGKRLKVTGLGKNKSLFEEYFDTVLFEYGRIPNTSHLGLCKIDVKVDKRTRKILVDDEGRTSVKHVFAIGDVLHGWPELASVAKKAGKFLIQKLYKGIIKDLGLDFIPERFLLPVEYARIGVTEQFALAQYGDKIKSYDAESQYFGHISQTSIRNYVYMKVLCLSTEENEKVIAVHLLCHRASEIIQGFSISLKKGLAKKDLDDMIALHALFCEVIPNLKLEPVRTPLDVNKAWKEKPKEKCLERAMEEVEPLRKKKKPPVADFQLEERGSDESAREWEYRRNQEALVPVLTEVQGRKDVQLRPEEAPSTESVCISTTSTESDSSTSSTSSSSTSSGDSGSTSSTSSSSSSSEDNESTPNDVLKPEEDSA